MRPGSADAGRRARTFQRSAGALYGLTFAFAVGLGHHVAGGVVPPVANMSLWLVGAAGVGALSSGLRWTFPRLLAVFVAMQPLVHLALSGHGAAMAGAHSATMAGSPAVMADHAGGSAWLMMVVHVTAAVVIACVVRFGWIWVSTMPALIEKVVCLARQVVAWPMTTTYRIVVEVEGAVAPGVGKVWRSRGPPCGVIQT